MKRILTAREKNKLGIAMLAVIVVIIMANWWLNFSVEKLGKSFESIYSDRLLPSMYSTEMQERLYQNRLYSERYLNQKDSLRGRQLKRAVEANIRETDSILILFENTKLVKEEASTLRTFRTDLEKLQAEQENFFAISRQGYDSGIAMLEGPYEAWLVKNIDYLQRLSDIQGKEGKLLYAEAEDEVAGIKLVTRLVGVIALVIMLIAGALFREVAIKRNRPEDPRLN